MIFKNMLNLVLFYRIAKSERRVRKRKERIFFDRKKKQQEYNSVCGQQPI